MRALVQRVREASVGVDGKTIAEIGPGLLIFICAMQGDSDQNANEIAAKISKLRIFRDADGRMNHSINDTGGSVLVVSQFTLAADTSRGNRPGFSTAASPDEGERLYEVFAAALHGLDLAVKTGRFGADMAVSLVNDGPVTIWMDNSA